MYTIIEGMLGGPSPSKRSVFAARISDIIIANIQNKPAIGNSAKTSNRRRKREVKNSGAKHTTGDMV
jgi:hypothetical protein